MEEHAHRCVWTSCIESIAGERGLKVAVLRDGIGATWAEVIRAWEFDPDFRSLYTGILADAPFRAYFWETQGLRAQDTQRACEFVLIDSPYLARMRPDRRAFQAQLRRGDGAPIAQFPNLGGDAWLLAPRQQADARCYAHLAAFVRRAPAAQQHALWRALGSALRSRLSGRPLWLSTSGTGVAWLHLRLDAAPKYYTHAPYAVGPGPVKGR